MTLLRWPWTMRPGAYGRAVLANDRQLFVLCVIIGIALGFVGFVVGRSVVAGVLVGLLALLLSPLLFIPRFRLSVRRQRRVSGADVRWYTLTPDALLISTGGEQASMALGELSVLRRGRDWLVLRQRGSTVRSLVLFDDPALVARAAEIIERHGAAA